MKKSLFFMAAATIALASCSNDDVIEVNKGNAIDFRASIGSGVNSRGLETKTGNLGQFKVTAINNGAKYFENVLFTGKTEGEKTTYTSDVNYFWPGDDSEVDFYAYSYYAGKTGDALNALNEDLYGTVTIDKDNHKIAFKVQDAVADQVDLVTANATGKGSTSAANGQKLTFGHALSQIQIKAKNTNKNYKYEVMGVKIGNVNNEGTYTLKSGETASSWSDTKGHQTFEVILTNAVTLDGTSEQASDIMGIADGYTGLMTVPQSLTPWVCTGDSKVSAKDNTAGAYIAVKVKITMVGTSAVIYPNPNVEVEEGETKPEYAYVYVPVPENTKWEEGKKYVYTLDFTNGAGVTEDGTPILGDPISFSEVEVSGWTEQTVTPEVAM